MAEIIWTLEAARWLEGIHDYIASDSPSAAHRVVAGIYDKIWSPRRDRHTPWIALESRLGHS